MGLTFFIFIFIFFLFSSCIVPLSRAVLPPIRGIRSLPHPEKDGLPLEDEAGKHSFPLPSRLTLHLKVTFVQPHIYQLRSTCGVV